MSSFEVPLVGNDDIPMQELPLEEFRLFLTDEITSENATELVKAFYDINDINKQLDQFRPIVLIINTPGGDLQASQMICDVMNEIETPVYTKCTGKACGGGIMIFMNGEPGCRISFQNCQFMSHRFSTAVEGSHTDLKYHNEEMDRMHERLVDHYVACTGLTKRKIESSLLTEHDVWLSPEEAKKLNIVDEIIPLRNKYERKSRSRKS
jgi:ATP-dependent Clp protease protease subunit